jgi:hypothetical protein
MQGRQEDDDQVAQDRIQSADRKDRSQPAQDDEVDRFERDREVRWISVLTPRGLSTTRLLSTLCRKAEGVCV